MNQLVLCVVNVLELTNQADSHRPENYCFLSFFPLLSNSVSDNKSCKLVIFLLKTEDSLCHCKVSEKAGRTKLSQYGSPNGRN